MKKFIAKWTALALATVLVMTPVMSTYAETATKDMAQETSAEKIESEIPAKETKEKETKEKETKEKETKDKESEATPTEMAKPEKSVSVEESAMRQETDESTVEISTQPETVVESTAETENLTQTLSENKSYDDGDYDVALESSFSMFKIVKPSAAISGNHITVTFYTEKNTYDKIYFGYQTDADKTDYMQGVKRSDVDGYVFTFELPADKVGQKVPFVPGKPDGSWYKNSKGTEYYLTIPELTKIDKEEEKETETSSEKESETDGTETPEKPENPTKLADGIYTASVTSSSGMFKVVACDLLVKDDKMCAVITLSGTGYDYLYAGTGAEAAVAADGTKIPFVINPAGQYTYAVPVSALDTPIAIAAHSIKNNTWYDRSLTFLSEGLKKVSSGESNQPGTGESDSEKESESGAEKETETVKETESVKETEAVRETEKETEKDTTPETESKNEADTSGSTGKVNSTTVLADGVYTPDRFSWSGGTGRVSLSCNKITVKNGQAYATIIFSSDSYSYVKANGRKYTGTSGGGVSTFVIPVELNQNNKVIGMTTKMSVSHEITYTLFIYLAAADQAADGQNGESNVNGENKVNQLDETAPVIAGLAYETETELSYASYFKMFHYAQGITLLEIDMTPEDTLENEDATVSEDGEMIPSVDKTDVEAEAVDENGEQIVQTEEEITSELYHGTIIKYLLVPEGVEVPAGLNKEMIIVQVPKESTYMAGAGGETEASASTMLKNLGLEAHIVSTDSLEMVDYKKLIQDKCSLVILPSELLLSTSVDSTIAESTDAESEDIYAESESIIGGVKQQDTTTIDKALDHFAMLQIPVIIDRSADEKTEIAQAEWIKVYGALYGCETQAAVLFDKAVSEQDGK